MKKFIIIKDGEIVRTGNCPGFFDLDSQAMNTGETVIEGEIDVRTQKIVDGEIVSKTSSEILTYDIEQIGNKMPPVDGITDDTAFNLIVDSHFLSQVNVTQWRIDHYEILRKMFYPKEGELLDAQVKINSGISALITEGQAQLDQYVEDCLNVKTRFPKE